MKLRRLLRDPLTTTGLALLVAFAAVALAAPWLAPPETPCPSAIYTALPDWLIQPFVKELACNPYKMPRDGFAVTPLPPDLAAWRDRFPPDWHRHPMGTTENRYDIYYGVVWGTRTALFTGVFIVLLNFVVGLVVGAVSGFYGGWVDAVLMRFVDFLFALPGLLVTLVVVAVLGRGLNRIVLVSVIFGWAWYARFVRGDVLAVRDREYVLAARALGASDARLITRHVVPNMIFPALILASLDVGTVVLGLSGLSFLGLGAGEDYADWGQMISLARNRIIGAVGGDSYAFWYTAVFPGLAIFLFVLGWNLIGDGVRDALDPRMGRGAE